MGPRECNIRSPAQLAPLPLPPWRALEPHIPAPGRNPIRYTSPTPPLTVCTKPSPRPTEIRRIWKEYHLEPRTRLSTRVTSVRRASVAEDDADPRQQGHARWLVNDGTDGVFDAVVVTVGTCGAPQWVGFPGMPDMDEIRARRARSQEEAREKEAHDKDEARTESDADVEHERKHSQIVDSGGAPGNKDGEDGEEMYAGTLLHSSELDDAQLAGKRVVVIGSGASGVEAVETALARGAKDTVIIARQDKVRGSLYACFLVRSDDAWSGSYREI